MLWLARAKGERSFFFRAGILNFLEKIKLLISTLILSDLVISNQLNQYHYLPLEDTIITIITLVNHKALLTKINNLSGHLNRCTPCFLGGGKVFLARALKKKKEPYASCFGSQEQKGPFFFFRGPQWERDKKK